jgi:hypothetical protein
VPLRMGGRRKEKESGEVVMMPRKWWCQNKRGECSLLILEIFRTKIQGSQGLDHVMKDFGRGETK